MTFVDRTHAARLLAEDLGHLRREDPVVVALPRGGVPVAVEVAKALGAPLDVLAVHKLGAPGNPEFAIGALAENGPGAVDRDLLRRTGMTEERFAWTLDREARELRRRVLTYRDGRAPIDVAGRTAIVVDDGLATGATDLAAVRALRQRGAARIIVAAPVGSRQAVATLRAEADDVICHTIPPGLNSVGSWYDDFSPVSDDEVVALLGEHVRTFGDRRQITLRIGDVTLHGDLVVPPNAKGLVIFAHGSGSSRHSPRNRAVAGVLEDAGFATLLFDLLDAEEEGRRDRVFDIALLTERLAEVTRQVQGDLDTSGLPIGYFGASTGAAAALRAAAVPGSSVCAVVSRGGRPDLAADRLGAVVAPTLLIVGGADADVLALNRKAAAGLRCPHRVVIVPHAGHLFSEPGALDAVAALARDWFAAHLAAPRATMSAMGR